MGVFKQEEDLFKIWYNGYKGYDDGSLKDFPSKVYMERDYMGRPVCFFEVARDHDTYDTEYFLTSLPKGSLNYLCYLVLYRLDDNVINNLRVKRVFPKERPFEELMPRRFLRMISAVKRAKTRTYADKAV